MYDSYENLNKYSILKEGNVLGKSIGIDMKTIKEDIENDVGIVDAIYRVTLVMVKMFFITLIDVALREFHAIFKEELGISLFTYLLGIIFIREIIKTVMLIIKVETVTNILRKFVIMEKITCILNGKVLLKNLI